jgi:hypothetical protein
MGNKSALLALTVFALACAPVSDDMGSDSSSSGAQGSSGDAAFETCYEFCSLFVEVCNSTPDDNEWNDYGTIGDCVQTCEGQSAEWVECRADAVGLVAAPGGYDHCGPATKAGASPLYDCPETT